MNNKNNAVVFHTTRSVYAYFFDFMIIFKCSGKFDEFEIIFSKAKLISSSLHLVSIIIKKKHQSEIIR